MVRAKKGQVFVILKNHLLCLRWRVPGTDARPLILLGVPDTPTNRRKAEIAARQIEEELESGATAEEIRIKYRHSLKPNPLVSFKQRKINKKSFDSYNRVPDVFRVNGS